MADVNGVSIRKQCKAIALGKALEEGILLNRNGIEDAIPDFSKLLESEAPPKAFCQMEIPVAGRHATFLPVGPARILLDCGP